MHFQRAGRPMSRPRRAVPGRDRRTSAHAKTSAVVSRRSSAETTPEVLILTCYTPARQPTIARRPREVGANPTRCRHCQRGVGVSMPAMFDPPAVTVRAEHPHTGRRGCRRRSASQDTWSPGRPSPPAPSRSVNRRVDTPRRFRCPVHRAVRPLSCLLLDSSDHHFDDLGVASGVARQRDRWPSPGRSLGPCARSATAARAGARRSLILRGTQVIATAKTADRGQFGPIAVAAGEYEIVAASAPALRSKQTACAHSRRRTRSIDLTMALSAVRESVVVSAVAGRNARSPA